MDTKIREGNLTFPEVVVSAPFHAIAPYYDRLMRDIPYLWWFHYVELLMDHFEGGAESVLDLCCGTGNLTELFALHGYQVVGVDISAPMIEQARQKAQAKELPIQYYVQDAAQLCLPERFDLVVSLFDSLNNLVESTLLQSAFDRVYQHLNPHGLFIFDLNTEYALANHLFDQVNCRPGSPIRYRWRSTYDKRTHLCEIKMEFWVTEPGKERAFVEYHHQRAYSEPECREMLRQAGFAEVHTFHAYTLHPPRRYSDRVFYVALKHAG